MDTWTMIDQMKDLKSKDERVEFVKNQLASNIKYSAPVNGAEYAAKPRALLYMISKDGKITSQTKEDFYKNCTDLPPTSDSFDKIASEVNKLRGF